jgi:hypothetical protein
MDATESSAIERPEHPPERSYTALERRALALFEERGHLIRSLGGERFEVPSSSMDGRRYSVRYGGLVEGCNCPDHSYHPERACKHLLCVGIAHATRRSGVRVRTISAAGDPFKAAAKAAMRPSGGREEAREAPGAGESLRGIHADLRALDRVADRLGV